MKPLIGISCDIKCVDKSGALPFLPQELYILGDAYTLAIERAGGVPVILPSCSDPLLMEEMVSHLDGVVISGGPDIDPALYGERIVGGVGPVNVRRDQAEAVLISTVMKNETLPILGICRGQQIINVIEGGSLIQDLKSENKAEHRLSMFPRNYPSHEVKLEEDSLIAKIMGTVLVRTNSFHHQAVREIAPNWRVVGHATYDDVVEAIEKPGKRFAVCVQWHPEAMPDQKEEQALFYALVAAAQEYHANKI